ncbi:unnamed protein product [Caenorhabditis auriculariae]|uniref:Uncharacterized protein n=1 Tax=Caenorhabditis auriculariae TaxID=2777116 RepID=A0A8S1GTR2_9PELO|nr:unnamed protein product [Caenorhabditis auriculariae]
MVDLMKAAIDGTSIPEIAELTKLFVMREYPDRIQNCTESDPESVRCVMHHTPEEEDRNRTEFVKSPFNYSFLNLFDNVNNVTENNIWLDSLDPSPYLEGSGEYMEYDSDEYSQEEKENSE